MAIGHAHPLKADRRLPFVHSVVGWRSLRRQQRSHSLVLVRSARASGTFRSVLRYARRSRRPRWLLLPGGSGSFVGFSIYNQLILFGRTVPAQGWIPYPYWVVKDKCRIHQEKSWIWSIGRRKSSGNWRLFCVLSTTTNSAQRSCKGSRQPGDPSTASWANSWKTTSATICRGTANRLKKPPTTS